MSSLTDEEEFFANPEKYTLARLKKDLQRLPADSLSRNDLLDHIHWLETLIPTLETFRKEFGFFVPYPMEPRK